MKRILIYKMKLKINKISSLLLSYENSDWVILFNYHLSMYSLLLIKINLS